MTVCKCVCVFVSAGIIIILNKDWKVKRLELKFEANKKFQIHKDEAIYKWS